MRPFNFRVKLDLKKYYHDVRQFCWVLVDGAKMETISNLQDHIRTLFGIQEPFHLVLNNKEYLPPVEDVRILKENEIVGVLPGSGINSETSEDVLSLLKQQEILNISNNYKECEINTVDQIEPVERVQSLQPIEQIESIEQEEKQPIILQPVEAIASYDTQTDASEADLISNTALEATDSETTLSMIKPMKRKRTRRSKKKKNDSNCISPATPQISPSTPKIICNHIVPTNKHIRFDLNDVEELDVPKLTSPKDYKNGTHPNNECQDKLSALLSLGKRRTPLTFAHNKACKQKSEILCDITVKSEPNTESCVERTMNEDLKVNGPANVTLVTDTCITPPKDIKGIVFSDTSKSFEIENSMEKEKTPKDFLNANPSEYQIMSTRPQVKDIIAFKMLKMGEDYTPQVSSFIIAEVLGHFEGNNPETLYNLKIYSGLEEIQTPKGKFSLEEEVELLENESDVKNIITLEFTQLMEIRLLSGCKVEKTA